MSDAPNFSPSGYSAWLKSQRDAEQTRRVSRDPVSAAVDGMRHDQIIDSINNGGSPDGTALTTKLARDIGEPPAMVEGRESQIQQYNNGAAFASGLESNPLLGWFFSLNSRHAVAAQDDAKAIAAIGQNFKQVEQPAPTLWNMAKGIGTAFVGSAEQMWQGLQLNRAETPSMAEDAQAKLGREGIPWAAKAAERSRVAREKDAPGIIDRYNATQAQIDAATPAFQTRTGAGVYGGISSFAQMLPALLATALTRRPGIGIGIAAVQTGLPSYAKYRAAGATPDEAKGGAITQGGAEALGEILPFGTIASKFGRAPLSKFLSEYIVGDLLGEEFTTAVQDAADTATGNPNPDWSAYLAARPDAAYQTLLGVLVAGGITGPLHHVATRADQANLAKQQASVIDGLGQAAVDSKLRARDPEGYNELIKHMGENSGRSHVFVPGEAVREYMQSDAYDMHSDPLSAYGDQVDEAAATGGDVVLPVEFALGTLPGTPAWNALKSEFRFEPDGLSAREADDFEGSMDQVMSELDKAGGEEKTGPRDVLLEKVQTKLQDAGFTPYVARQQAELLVQRMETRAGRMGNNLSGGEFDKVAVRQVLPPALAEARSADTLDLVINAMRKDGAPAKQGQSLLEFIASKGGIEDKGGNIASMGGDKWHREKSFRRKLLKPYVEGQGSIIGGEHNPNSIESMYDAAVSSGYFPEQLVQRENASTYGEALNTNDFLDAIGSELRGSPIYAGQVGPDHVRDAASELEQMLVERGMDPASMSGDEIRAAVASMSDEGDGSGYEQAAYHGSPHIFDKFSLDHVGEGEGNQVYGWGLYFASRKGIAEHYRKVLAGNQYYETSDYAEYFTPGRIVDAYGGKDKVISFNPGPDGQPWNWTVTVQRVDAQGNDIPHERPRTHSTRPTNDQMKAVLGRVPEKAPGRLYEVEIPEDSEYLLWDKPLSEQSEHVREQFDWAWQEAVQSIRKERDRQGIENPDAYNPTKPDDAGEAYRKLGQMMHSDKAASMALHDLGIAGVKYLDGASRSQGDGSYNYVVFDDSKVQIRSYEQEARGRIQFLADQSATIELFKGRNLSTLLHETSHLWLEELRFDASLPGAPEQIKADWQTVQDWFSSNGHPLDQNGNIPTEAHELWARSGERYFMEGKAPAAGLKRLFETFRGWLVAIYKHVDALKAPITPEIREVFDRLIATDDQIEQARQTQVLQPLFQDAASVGMTDPEFSAYASQVRQARDEAQGELLDKTMAAIRRRETARYKEARKGVEAEMRQMVDDSPVMRAIRHLKAQPMDAQWLRDEFGADAIDMLPRGTTKEGGARPSQIAELAGYDTSRQMIEALIGVEQQHKQAREQGDKRSMRERMVQTATDNEMNRRYGDPLNDGTIEREALEAVHNEKQGEVFGAELRALSRKTGQRPTPYRIARDWARNKVQQGVYQVEASPGAIQRHSRAIAKAGREAEKALAAGKFDEAFRAKQQQMLSSALLAEAKAANDAVETARKRMDRVARQQTSKTIDQEYLDQAHALLEAVDLRQRTAKSVERQGKWEAWANAREAEGYDITVPPSFEATIGQTNWSKLTVENLLGLDEAVKQIMHLGRMKQTLLDGKERREFDEMVLEAQNGAGNIKGKPPTGLAEKGFIDGIKAGAAAVDSTLLKMETVFDWLDGGDSNGVFNRIVFRPISEAQGREQDMLADYLGRIKGLFSAVPGEVVEKWRDKTETPFTDPFTGKPYTPQRQRLISMALNIGNEGNMQRLADGYGWNAGAIERFLTDELTEGEWQFVQGVWDTIETLWPEIEALEKRVNGIAPDKVEPRAIVTPHGTYRGGYYPAIYDSTLSYAAEKRAGKESDLFEGNYTRATTRSSATKARADKVSQPILLDLGVINRHLGEVIHDVTHREAVMQANKFLSSERVMRTVDEALGQQVRGMFRPWVKFVANSWAMERAGNEGFGKWLGKLRANATAVGMGLRATTMMTQIAGYSNSFEVVGEKWVAESIARFTANPIKTSQFVMERSDEVRHRMDTLDRDIRTELARLTTTNPASKLAKEAIDAKRFFFHGIGYMDRAVSVPTWLGAYNKALAEGMNERDAAYAGDKAVRVSQGAGAPKDLAAIQRGTGKWGEALKLFTMFYSFQSMQYQRQRTLVRDAMGADTRRPRNVPKLAARAFWLVVVPPLLTEVIKMGLGGGNPPDDDESWAEWVARKILANGIGSIPLARDIFEPTWNAARGAQVYNPEFSPINRVGTSLVNVMKDTGNKVRGKETKHMTKDVLEATGYVTGLVPGQVASASQFLVDVGQGDARPRDFSDWVEGLSTGKLKDK